MDMPQATFKVYRGDKSGGEFTRDHSGRGRIG